MDMVYSFSPRFRSKTRPLPEKYFIRDKAALSGFTAFFENRLCAYSRIFPLATLVAAPRLGMNHPLRNLPTTETCRVPHAGGTNPIQLSKNAAGDPSPLRRLALRRHPPIPPPPRQEIFTHIIAFHSTPTGLKNFAQNQFEVLNHLTTLESSSFCAARLSAK